MRTSIAHLPSQVQNDLTYIAKLLVEQTIANDKDPYRRYTPSRIRHIILHGCFTEDHWRPDTELRPDDRPFRYTLMVIVSAHLCDILCNLERAIEQVNQSGKVSFPVLLQVADTRGRIDQRLRNGYLAYDQIQTRGILIYSKGDTSHDLFTIPDLPPVEEHYVQARDYFDHAYPLAELFLSGARSFEDKDRNAAAFMLNVAAAQAYEALMVIHTLKYPLGRPLNALRELAESLHPELAMVWTGLRGEQIFDHLSIAFRDVRFSAYYHVTDSALDLMFGYVEDLHKLVHHICQIKFDALKAGSLAKPRKNWLEVVGQALKPPEDPMFGDDDEEEEPEVLQTTVPDPSLIFRTPEQEEALEKLGAEIFNLEEPCYDLQTLGNILKCMTYKGYLDEERGIHLLGDIIQVRTTAIKDTFIQMLGLLRQVRTRDDDPAEDKSDLKNNKESTDVKEQKVA
ncbi:MAG: hypothetical protein L3J58_08470 [Emcibacter sp.]|nr:hypothetical protein [Emcibacter sp.]